MIKEISNENIGELEILDEIIFSYFKHMKEKYNQSEYPLKERLRKGINESKIIIHLATDENSEPVGFAIAHKVEGRFSIILDMNDKKKSRTNKSIEIEKTLFDVTFSYLKNTHDIIRIAGDISTFLKQHALNQGFTNYKRARMGITREKVKALEELELDSDFHFTSWTNEMKEIFADIMAEHHFSPNHPDGFVFSQYTGFDGCKRLLEEMTKNTFGKFTSSQTRILKHGDEHIGMCSVTKLDSNNGYIPEIIISQQYKGKGIGKTLLVHGIKHYMNEEETSLKIELDVTLMNTKAANLYESIGFEQINTYSVLVWNQN